MPRRLPCPTHCGCTIGVPAQTTSRRSLFNVVGARYPKCLLACNVAFRSCLGRAAFGSARHVVCEMMRMMILSPTAAQNRQEVHWKHECRPASWRQRLTMPCVCAAARCRSWWATWWTTSDLIRRFVPDAARCRSWWATWWTGRPSASSAACARRARPSRRRSGSCPAATTACAPSASPRRPSPAGTRCAAHNRTHPVFAGEGRLGCAQYTLQRLAPRKDLASPACYLPRVFWPASAVSLP